MADPIQPDCHASMNRLAQVIDRGLNGTATGRQRRFGFILLVAEFGQIEDGRVNYISNGQRADMIAMLREYLARIEGRAMDAPGTKQ